VILGFIGAKLVIHALHTNELPFINGGEHVTVIPEVPIWLSLLVILVTLTVTTVASLARSRRDRAAQVGSEESGGRGAGTVSAANSGRREH
jgi:tellurite resistance protein TerC